MAPKSPALIASSSSSLDRVQHLLPAEQGMSGRFHEPIVSALSNCLHALKTRP